MSTLTPEECLRLRELAIEHLIPAKVGHSGGETRWVPTLRNADHWKVPEDSEAWDLLSKVVPFFDAQIIRYGLGGHYVWHSDGTEANGRLKTTIVLLSDPSEFEGGGLEVVGPWAVGLEQGVAFSFPANKTHRVLPVTSGERWVAVIWS